MDNYLMILTQWDLKNTSLLQVKLTHRRLPCQRVTTYIRKKNCWSPTLVQTQIFHSKCTSKGCDRQGGCSISVTIEAPHSEALFPTLDKYTTMITLPVHKDLGHPWQLMTAIHLWLLWCSWIHLSISESHDDSGKHNVGRSRPSVADPHQSINWSLVN